jgi:short-subunit dehydrogenase
MRPRKTGTIIWIGSFGGYRPVNYTNDDEINNNLVALFCSGYAGAGLYCATKHAIRCISESLHEEISPLGLRSLLFEPGYFRTDFLTADNRGTYGGNIPDYEPIIRASQEGLDGS